MLTIPAWRALCFAAAAVVETPWRGAFVPRAWKGRGTARAVDADLALGASTTTLIAVHPRRADTLVVLADLLTKTFAAIDRWRGPTAPSLYRAALGAASSGGTGELLAPTQEVLRISAALSPFGAIAALDRPFATVGKGAAFDRNPEGRELGDDLFARLGLAARFLSVVAPTIAVPTEVTRRTVRLLATAEEAVGDGKVATTQQDETERQYYEMFHQNFPLTEIPVGPMLTSGTSSS